LWVHQLIILRKLGFAQASYTALTTLAFVAPAVVSPCVLAQLKSDVNVAVLNNISELDLGVWATTEGATFVNGLHLSVNPIIASDAETIQYFLLRKTLDPVRAKIMKLPNGKKVLENRLRQKKRRLLH